MSVQSGWSRFTWGQANWSADTLLATGWGAKAWNDGEYGNLADETVSSARLPHSPAFQDLAPQPVASNASSFH